MAACLAMQIRSWTTVALEPSSPRVAPFRAKLGRCHVNKCVASCVGHGGEVELAQAHLDGALVERVGALARGHGLPTALRLLQREPHVLVRVLEWEVGLVQSLGHERTLEFEHRARHGALVKHALQVGRTQPQRLSQRDALGQRR
eukprot:2734002-Pleurochrysis_carterae.AAC.4